MWCCLWKWQFNVIWPTSSPDRTECCRWQNKYEILFVPNTFWHVKFKPSVLSEFRWLSCSLIIIEHDYIVVILLGVATGAVFEWRYLSSLAEFVLLDKNRLSTHRYSSCRSCKNHEERTGTETTGRPLNNWNLSSSAEIISYGNKWFRRVTVNKSH